MCSDVKLSPLLAVILAIILMAPGAISYFFLLAFAFVMAGDPLVTAAIAAVVTLVVSTCFDYVIAGHGRKVERGQH